ncbi:MAG: hypothetical protein KatS3mg082_3259 [Nitrospiraceae bacterium]|nr:MAG: hypothetical protein KatS3mg082_3259 [Nitrospiraceae bacterium]
MSRPHPFTEEELLAAFRLVLPQDEAQGEDDTAVEVTWVKRGWSRQKGRLLRHGRLNARAITCGAASGTLELIRDSPHGLIY